MTFKSRMRVPLQIVMVYQNTILGFIKLAFVYEWMAFSNLGVEENLLTEPELLPELWPKKLGCYLWSVTVGSSSILIVLAASFPSAIVFCMKFSQGRSMGKDWTGPQQSRTRYFIPWRIPRSTKWIQVSQQFSIYTFSWSIDMYWN